MTNENICHMPKHQWEQTEVMRITKDGVYVNPEVTIDYAARTVLEALDSQIKVLVQKAVEAEREACASVCDKLGDEFADANAAHCADAIRARGQA